MSPPDVVAELGRAGAVRADPVALALPPAGGLALAHGARTWSWDASALPRPAAIAAVAELEHALRPRWVWWSAAETAGWLTDAGLRVATCWDVAAVHRLLAGGTTDAPGIVWAALTGLDPTSVPRTGQLDLLAAQPGPDGDPDDPLDGAGHLRAEWVDGGWGTSADRAAAWAGLALQAHRLQLDRLAERAERPDVTGDPVRAAHAESATALLCVELERDGLPVDVPRAEELVAEAIGPRPDSPAQADELRRARDRDVLRHAPVAEGSAVDLRNPAQVRGLLAGIGIDVPDTRSWRLEPWRDTHPLVAALLAWRKADRIGTTYGYSWLDRYVGPDGRLRGPWQASDGAAGRMTAGAGLHNLPAELRPAVCAPPGHVLVRADLGQVEPRVLAAVSGDAALAAATRDDDLYAPVASRLGVERSVAKVAVLAAMYGQTSGTAGAALRGLEQAYPTAMRYLYRASERGQAGHPVFTHGGRRVPMWQPRGPLEPAAQSALVAARGRFARNAVVQGSAAELFKAWAATVRARAQSLDAHVVLCLHDELLVLAQEPAAARVAELLVGCLDEASWAWQRRAAPSLDGPAATSSGGAPPVRFVADVRVVHRWSEAK